MMNRVVLVGRLTKDPELRYTPAGVAVATFTLAVNRTFTNQQGERTADFINCVVWRKPAENVANFLKKGSMAGVDGRIQTRNYEGKDGKRVYVTEIVAEGVQFLEPRNANGSNYPLPDENEAPPGYGNTNNQQPEDPFKHAGNPVVTDDVPF
ncbi:single-stranded DNA-binding protein [Listeria seeligeri]|uniref:single-stranded DNA-binding protein n=1 Tax=Listeria seeligeri TaxID=1640 RepID=UPI001625FBD4|nr:single-stranded DNA-binding protein [Listeria seeligeri]MBC1917067.1 single-stranded DNA-binding protein [Listeria seeligeri]